MRGRTSLGVKALAELERGDMYFYIARELAPSLFVFSVVFSSLGLVMLSLFFVWTAGGQAAAFACTRFERHDELDCEFIKERRKRCLDTD
jgi:hypothetical protein